MSFPRYPEYKDSGVEWLGEVPAHWNIGVLARVTTRIVVGIAEATTHAYSESGIPILRAMNIRSGKIIGDMIYIHELFDEDRKSKQLHEGDLVTVRTGNAGVTAIIPKELEGCQCFTMLITTLQRNRFDSYFACYWMNSNFSQMYFSIEGWGTAQINISVPILKSLPIFIPTLSEQQAIATFLDRETAKIDALVEEQKRLIELLKEKRQAVISHAVTKGLDPNAKMKDSGVEWLGMVPEGWEVVPLKWFSSCSSGNGISTEEIDSEKSENKIIPVIGGNGEMGFTDKENINHSVLAVGRVGALCGNVHFVNPPAWITDNALVLDVSLTHFNPIFLSEVLRTRNLNDLASKTAQPLITGTMVGDQRLPRPPINEQEAIVIYINMETKKIDNLTGDAQSAVDLLQERRTALISAAVTGKIDVSTELDAGVRCNQMHGVNIVEGMV